MADENAEGELEWIGRSSLLDEQTFFAMESLQATLQQLEAELRQQDISQDSSTEYCDNFCQALIHYAGSRNSLEHGLSLLEVYCLSINCFAAARPHLTGESPNVGLVLKRLALSCLELLLSVPQHEIPLEAWLQFHGSVQAAHESILQYGSTDLQALLNILGEGGAWNNPVLVSLLTDQQTEPGEVNSYLALEGEGFMEMRIKHLEKVGEDEKALILNRACANCSLLPNQASFRQNYVTQLCHQLPKKEAIIEICRMDGKDILDIICNLETEGEENTAFILCTTYFTQQLQQDNLYCAWELTLLWSKLQRRIDVSLESFLERCLQFGSIARTIYHCLFLIRVIQTEAAQLGLAVSVDLCVKALWQEETDAKALVCKMVSSLLSEDLEVIRACQLTEFVLSPSQEAFDILEELHTRPDQKYDEENALIPNSMRCELLLALKAHWHFDPEFWDWKTLKRHCIQLLGLEPEEEVHDDSAHNSTLDHQAEILNGDYVKDEDKPSEIYGIYSEQNEERSFSQKVLKSETIQLHNRSNKVKKHTFRCQLCHKEVAEAQICHHAKRHEEDGVWTCPMCLEQFRSRKLFVPHAKKHVRLQHWKKENVKEKSRKNEDGVDDHEPGKIRLDPSHAMYSQSTHDPAVLEHILEASSVPNNDIDDDFITFDYINTHFSLQNRDVYQCPATDCSKTFKLYKYLGVHLKNDHNFRDPNVKHYLDMKDRREKCTFCRKTFMTSYHQRKHCKVHYKDHPYSCAVTGCGAHFDTTNELVTHKREHGFRLTYCCDLTGCGFAYCDLGQLYHHEAQHFRDAAFTCVSPGCKMYFYSRKEFVNHLAGHDMKFTDKDFERQRAVKKDLRPLVEDSDLRGTSENGFQKAEKPSGTKEQGSLTCVAVCFDGKKFICGLNKCGKSFALVKEIQKHLKHDHADDFVEEDKLFKKKKKKNNKVKHSDTEASEIQQKSLDAAQDHLSSEESTQEKNTSPAVSFVESQPKLGMEPDVVMTELMLRLNNLTLNCPGSEYGLDVGTDALGENSPDEKNKSASDLKRTHSKSDPVKHETKSDVTSTDLKRMQSKSDPVKEKNKSDAIATTLKTTMIKLERVKEKIDLDVKKLIKPRSKFESESGTLEKLNGCVPENQQLKRKSEIQIQGELQKKGVSKKNSQLSSKSYTCNGKNCYFQSDTNEGLKQHYMKVHCFSEKDAKEMSAEQLKQELLAQGTSKPFVCDAKACHYQSVTSEALLKHYTNIHNFTVEKVKKMEVFQPKIFKPFQCLLCQKDYSSKKQLKVHYFTLHNIEQSVLQQMCCSLRINSASSSKKKKSLQPLKINKLKSKRTDRCLWQQRCQKPDYRFHKINHKTGKGKAELSFSSNRDMADDVKSTPTSNCTNPTIQPCSELHLCVHRNCKASFNSLKNLLHHLLSEHHYQRSQLYYPCKFSGCSKLFGHYSSLTRHLRREHNLMQKNFLKTSIIVKENDTVKSEEPIPRFKCTYTNCNESYHLKSSLLRHTDFVHHNQTLQNSNGDLNSRSKKQALYQKCHAPDSLVVRLQSTPKNDESNHGCQTKLIVSTSSQSSRCCLKDEEKETATESVEPKSGLEKVALRTHEEAFQMCQDRCLPVAFPCMVQKCNSVVTTKRSLYRHYIAIHKLHRKTLTDNKAKLVYSVEQLEEMIQKKSALPDVVRTPNGVLKMQYQPATKGGPSLPVSLHSIKARLNKQATEFSDVPDRNLVAAAEDLLYCPPKSEIFIEIPNHSEKSEPTHPLVRPPPLDLSPPSNLRITLDDCTLELSGKGTCGKSMTIPTTVAKSVSNPTRQPLRRKNEYSDHPAQIPPASIPKDLVTQAFAPEAFDITTYKPMGFETSFLKFIQEKDEFESPWTTVVTNPCLKTDSPRRRDCFRRNYSVKENNQRGSSISRKIRSSPLKHLISKGDCTSIHNLRLILERALSGCGDQAIEQLQILKPVVVLERPESFASILDLLPS